MRRNTLPGLVIAFSIVTLLPACSQFIAATHDGPVHQDPGQRSRGEKIDDRQITTHLKVNLKKADPELAKANIDIVSYNGVVLLTGEVPSQQLRELAGSTANAIAAVRQVHNQLSIAGKATVYSRANDSWIATKIRGKILNGRIVETNRVKIIVENRVVYIMGLLTENEAQYLTELARTTKGVVKVVRAIELVPEHERAPH